MFVIIVIKFSKKWMRNSFPHLPLCVKQYTKKAQLGLSKETQYFGISTSVL